MGLFIFSNYLTYLRVFSTSKLFSDDQSPYLGGISLDTSDH